ncbi:hydrolase, TatD family [Leptospira broomii serovar Hurstbridge str. 5399]|uniref:Hydrolase, TatD family n=1 Tax=Leptospira broomii serovar Hurstbridge str. 5399 TaxID=1049789 RepID=T0FD07_9LEPT|nr:TatD family hydrolase [Leptospira broomii]EQA45482.1 hydrolase, TatD family [Leptospira broomii serovar Hurstbridge str. 5399]
MYSIIDTHCHLDIVLEQGQTIDQSLRNAKESGIKKIVQIGIDLESSIRAKGLSEEYSDSDIDIFYSIGCHPTETHEFSKKEEILSYINENVDDSRLSAIGEIGLDYYHDASSKNEQIEVLHSFLDASHRYRLPVVIHSRDAGEDTIAILKEHRDKAFGVIHCFTYDYSIAKRLVDLGYYISFSGILAFKNAKDIQEAAEKLPLEALLIETDAPFLAPPPFRGKRNEPAFTKFVLEKMFSLRKESNIEVEKMLYSNSEKFIERKPFYHA